MWGSAISVTLCVSVCVCEKKVAVTTMSATSSTHHKAPSPRAHVHTHMHAHAYAHTRTPPSTQPPRAADPCYTHKRTCACMFQHTHTHKRGGAKKVREAGISSRTDTALEQSVALAIQSKSCALHLSFWINNCYYSQLQVQSEWAVSFTIWPPGCHRWRWSIDQHSTGSTYSQRLWPWAYWTRGY